MTLAAELSRSVRGEVRFGLHDRLLYATDASLYQVEPIGVVIPASIEDAERAVAVCTAHGVAILPRGGGTSLAGQAVGRAVVIDLSTACGALLELDPVQCRATVQPGLILDELNRRAAFCGLRFGPDVASSAHATLGGMIGNNSAGAHSILYGRTVEHLESVDLLTAGGERLRLAPGPDDARVQALTRAVADIVRPLAPLIRQRYPRILRHVDGYNLDLMLEQVERSDPRRLERVNLAALACGSEGTLGVIVEATLRLVEAPRARSLRILGFSDVDEALAAVPAILETRPAAVELIDDVIMRLAERNVVCRGDLALLPRRDGGVSGGGAGLPGAVLYVEHFGESEEALRECLDHLSRRVSGVAAQTYLDSASMSRAWRLRRSGEPLLHAVPGPRKPITFVEDLAVDPSRLADFVKAFRGLVARHGTVAAFYAHASVGCLHIRPMLDLSGPEGRDTMRRIAEESTDLVRSFGGALSGEHGDGRARSHLLERFYGPEICGAFARIKALFDPRGLFNPGIIVDAPSMTESLRVRPREKLITVPAVDTAFRYDRQHGFAEAVTACNGAGVCRKRQGGTMCPSYRATLDERHSTRGRGNALRLAISGQFGAPGAGPAWDDPETIATLDLCLSCKACKSECPSNVDIAKLKAEYTAQRHRALGSVPWRTRIMGNVRGTLRRGSAMAPLANAILALPPVAALAKRAAGIDPRRNLPRFALSLERWFRRRRGAIPGPGPGAPAVVLFPDCFTSYLEPRIGRAAVTLLESLGYRVVLPRLGCCARSMISCGMVDEASRTVAATAGALLRCIEHEQAVAVVGCEPSCVSAVIDDWPDLRSGVSSERLQWLADHTHPVEDFLEAHWTDHPRPLHWMASDGPPVLLHGHCHHKALLGLDRCAALLRRFVGDRLRVLDTGCCGMAGSFGYSHHDLSMKIAELVLFPALRERPGAVVVASGTSCRQQIHDGTGRRALHPIEVLHSAPAEVA